VTAKIRIRSLRACITGDPGSTKFLRPKGGKIQPLTKKAPDIAVADNADAFKRRTRESNPQPVTRQLISNQPANHSLILRTPVNHR
jgi:hypothetical protein